MDMELSLKLLLQMNVVSYYSIKTKYVNQTYVKPEFHSNKCVQK